MQENPHRFSQKLLRCLALCIGPPFSNDLILQTQSSACTRKYQLAHLPALWGTPPSAPTSCCQPQKHKKKDSRLAH